MSSGRIHTAVTATGQRARYCCCCIRGCDTHTTQPGHARTLTVTHFLCLPHPFVLRRNKTALNRKCFPDKTDAAPGMDDQSCIAPKINTIGRRCCFRIHYARNVGAIGRYAIARSGSGRGRRKPDHTPIRSEGGFLCRASTGAKKTNECVKACMLCTSVARREDAPTEWGRRRHISKPSAPRP